MRLSDFKRTLGRGIAIAIPLGVIAYVFIKIVAIFEKLIRPVANKLGIEKILGELTLTILAVLILFLIMLLLGVLMQLSFFAAITQTVEDVVIKFIPSLNNVKSLVEEKFDIENASPDWKPVILLHEQKYFGAFIIEELENLITLYVLKGISLDEGEILITDKKDVVTFDITASDLHKFGKQFGKGYLPRIKKLPNT